MEKIIKKIISKLFFIFLGMGIYILLMWRFTQDSWIGIVLSSLFSILFIIFAGIVFYWEELNSNSLSEKINK